jgi:hypothetical protein
MKNVILAGLWFAAMAAGSARGGLGTTTGKEPSRFTKDGYSVIVGIIRDIKEIKGSPSRYQATLVPEAMLAGNFDPSLHPTLLVSFDVGLGGSSIREPPADGATVLTVVVVNMLNGDDTVPSNFIIDDIFTFMPDQSGLVPIKGLDDPRVAETLKKIQDARAHPDPDPNAPKPAMQPATP